MSDLRTELRPALRPPSIRALAWRQTLRDFRAGELRLLAVAVMLAVAALTAVGFFADRLGNGLQRTVLSDWDLAATPPRAEVLRLTAQGLERVNWAPIPMYERS